MYESPIKVVFENAQQHFEDGIFRAIQKADIYVDRDELLKALQYDRGQYEKGLADAVRRGHWTITKDGAAHCSSCKRKMNSYVYGYAYCPLCGAKMDERSEDK